MAGRQGLSAARQSTKSIAARSRPDTPRREAAGPLLPCRNFQDRASNLSVVMPSYSRPARTATPLPESSQRARSDSRTPETLSRCTITLAISKNGGRRSRIVFDCRTVNDAATIKDSTMKTILTLMVGLILAGCGSTENHVRNHGVGAASTSAGPSAGPGDRIAVDTICACP